MKAPLTDPTKGLYYKTLSTAPLNQVGFYNQTPRKDPTKVWQTPLNFDDPSCVQSNLFLVFLYHSIQRRSADLQLLSQVTLRSFPPHVPLIILAEILY